MKPCLVDECPNPAGVPGTARGWCSKHYNRWQSTGNPLTSATDLKPKPSPTCSVEGCQSGRWARGLCGTHYRRLMTRGEVGGAERETEPAVGLCSIPKCRRPVRSKSLCQRHFLRKFRHGDPLAGGTAQGLHVVCLIRYCQRTHYARGLCHAHWSVLGQAAERARRLGLVIPGVCTPSQLVARINYYGNRCWICGVPADQTDHVKPLSAGGSNWPSNLRPACASCNARKAAAWPFTPQTQNRLEGAA